MQKVDTVNKKVLITGNGFDLYHNLPTAYNDFMDVMNRLLELESENIKYIKLAYIFGKDSPLYSKNQNIKKCYDTFYDKICGTDLNLDSIHEMIKIAKDNVWFSYFAACIKNNIGWIDFEKEVRYVLNQFEIFFKKSNQAKLHDFSDGILFEKINLNDETKYIIEFFAFFQNNNLLNRYDYLSAIAIDKKFCLKRMDCKSKTHLVGIDKYAITRFLSDELNMFSKLFEYYIVEFINNISIDKTIQSDLFSGIDRVITFNYTNTFLNIYDDISDENIEYIHGKAGNGNIIFGVNSDIFDELETLDINYVLFKKEYKRIINGNIFKYKKFIQFEEGFDLIFFGHSLDITDADIIKDLISSNYRKCIIYCYDASARDNYVQNLYKLFGRLEIMKMFEEKSIDFKILFD